MRPFNLLKSWPLMAAFLITASVVIFLQFSSRGLAGNDGYYHIAMGRMILEQGLYITFPYLEFTLLDQAHFVDMHMLFHVLQAPFTAFLNLEQAAKISSAMFVGLTFTLFVWMLKKHDVPYPLFWMLVLLALSPDFFYRMLMPRPPIFALAYTWLAFHFFMRKNFKAVALVSCLFVWTYKIFPILLPMACLAMFVHYMEHKKVDFRPIIAVMVGIVAGMVINPYFPDNVSFLWDAIHMKIFSNGFKASVGNEWYPFNSYSLLKDAALPLVAYLGGILLTDRHEWKTDPRRLFWFLLASMWLLMLLKSRRFIEFFPPAALLFFIFAAKPWLQRMALSHPLHHRRVWGAMMVAVCVLLGSGYHTLHKEYRSMKHKKPVSAYQGGARWLADHTPAGSRVFHTDWDDFPRLFFHNRHNTYIVGLDPDYMRLKNHDIYHQWHNVVTGRNKHPADVILNTFGSEYVFSDRKHSGFRRRVKHNPRFKRVYKDKYTVVYHVLKKGSAQSSRRFMNHAG